MASGGNPEAKHLVAFVGTRTLDINIDPSDGRTQTQSSAASQLDITTALADCTGLSDQHYQGCKVAFRQ